MNDMLPKRHPGQHGVPPLSLAYRRRLLASLQGRADAGDVEAAAALIRIGLESERMAKASAANAAAAHDA